MTQSPSPPLRLEDVWVVETEPKNGPARSGERPLRFIAAMVIDDGRHTLGILKAPLVISNRGGHPLRTLEAVGLSDRRDCFLVAEASLPPGDYWIECPFTPARRRGFRLPQGTEPPIDTCGHDDRLRTEIRSRHIFHPDGRTACVERVVTMQPCCAAAQAVPAHPGEQMYGLEFFQPLRGVMRRIIDLKKHVTASPGEYLVINPVEISDASPRQTYPLQFRVIAIPQDALRTFRDELGLLKTQGPFGFASGPRKISRALGGVLALLDTYPSSHPKIGRDLFNPSIVKLFLVALLNDHPNTLMATPKTPASHDARLDRARAYILQHYAKPLTVRRVAQEIGIGPDWLRLNFHVAFGTNPKEFLLSTRMTKAMELFKNPTMTVEHVALAVGYRDPRPFRRAFLSHVNASPTSFRASQHS